MHVLRDIVVADRRAVPYLFNEYFFRDETIAVQNQTTQNLEDFRRHVERQPGTVKHAVCEV
jgi:hypothetical protein